MEPGPTGPGRDAIRLVSEPGTRASLLLDLIEDCQPGRCAEDIDTLLEEVRRATGEVSDQARQASLLLRLARLERQRGDREAAGAALERALQAARQAPAVASPELMLRLAMALEQAGEQERAAALWRQFGPGPGCWPSSARPSPSRSGRWQHRRGWR